VAAAVPHDELSGEDLRFRFLAGRVGIAVTATVGERWRRNFERLREGTDLARWLVEAGLLTKPPIVLDDELAAARMLREAIYRAAKAYSVGESPRPTDVARVNAQAREPPLTPQMRRGRLVWTSDRPVPAALSLIARDALEVFAGPLASRIRECESMECALLFVDSSRPGRRRWCSSETCGGRVRAAAYRNRRSQPK